MGTWTKGIVTVAALLLLATSSFAAGRYEVVAEENTILCDDSDAILMGEYVRRARDSMTKTKPRTAAAQLRRVAALAGRAADATSGEARDVLKSIQNQALKLAYAAETNSESAGRQVRDFAARTENFLEGEWSLLESKQALTRGDLDTAKILLTLSAQQIERRAVRAPKGRATRFEYLARDFEDLLKDKDALKSATAMTRLNDLIKAVHALASPEVKPTKTETPYDYSEYPSRGTESYGKGLYGSEKSSLSVYDSETYVPRPDATGSTASDAKKKAPRGKKDASKTVPYGAKTSESGWGESRSEDLSTSPTESDELRSSDFDTSTSQSSDTKTSASEQGDSEP